MPIVTRALLATALALALAGPTPASSATPSSSAQQSQDTGGFHALLDRRIDEWLATDPELQTMLGLDRAQPGQAAKLTDVSLPRREEIREQVRRLRAEIASIDRDSLTGQERVTHAMASWYYDRMAEPLELEWAPAWLPLGNMYAVDQLFSSPVQLPSFMDNHHQVRDEASARDYITRLEAIGTKLDQIGENFDMQASHGVVPPAVALEGAAGHFRSLLQPEPAESPFVLSLQRKLEALPDLAPELREELLKDATRAVRDHTNPGYRRLLAKVEAARAENPDNHGVWALPGGDGYYDMMLRWNTSTELDAGQIHRLGLEEVARIEAEMDALLRSQGHAEGTVAERITALAGVPELNYADSDAGRTELLGDIERILAELEPHIPTLFNRVPHQALEVKRVPEQAEATAPGGYYYPPALDGSRPGTFFINLGDMAVNTRWNLPTLVYHEGAPGHHFQISIGQTLKELPFLRRNLNPSAFTEGWALYAEQLAKEAGLYDEDPMGDLGRLQAEMFRAVRLVVDTGLHRQRWTMERAMDYMAEKTGMAPSAVRTEIHRYLVQPGQATSYKVGHLTLLDIRERARDRLGDGFDIRAFHDVVLGNGALPLQVLETVVEDWASTTEAGGA